MFTDRLDVYSNAIKKHAAHIIYTQHNTVILKCININLKKTVIIPTHTNIYYNK